MTGPNRDDVVVRALRKYILANGGEISSASGVADFYRQAGDHEDIYKETLRALGARKAEVFARHGLVLEKRSGGSDVIKVLDDPARGESSRLGGEAEAQPNYGTKPCKHFEKGRCKHGDQCTFLHAPTTQGGGGGGGREPFDGHVSYLHSQHNFAVVDHEIYISSPLPSGLKKGWRVWGTKTAGQGQDKYKWKATKVDGATSERGSGDDGGSAERPADQRAPPCKFFAQGACQFGDRCRFRHDRTSSSAQSSAQSSTRSAGGPRQQPTTQLKCTAEVVKLKRKADGARAATAQPNAPTILRLTVSLCVLTLLACRLELGPRADEFGFLRIHSAYTLAVLSVFGLDEAEKDHYFRLEWLPSAGQRHAPVREGDSLSCLIGVDARAAAESGRPRIKLRQLMLEKCGKLTDEEMHTYLKAVHEKSESEPEAALIMISKCAAPWRYILQCRSLDDQLTRMLLKTLRAILSSPAMQEKQHDLIRSFGESHFLLRDGPLSRLMRKSRQQADSDSSETDQLVASVIEGTLLIAPEAARALYHVLDEFFRPDGTRGELLLRVIRRLLPASVRVEQSQWNELPLVASPHELLGEVDPLLFTPSVIVKGAYSSAADYFDTYFRLMRCEGFGELSSGIGSLLKGKLDARDMNVYKDVTVQGVRFGTGADGAMTIALTYSPLTKRGSKGAVEIMFGNLLCISLDGSFKEPLWAVVAHCEVEGRQAYAHVRLCTEYNQSDDLEALLRLQRCKTTLMAESPTYFNAVRPVLRALQLQDPSSLPFESELVYGCRPSGDGRSFLDYDSLQEWLSPAAPKYIQPDSRLDTSSVFPGSVLTAGQFIERLKDPGELRTSFDESQRLAIAAVLQQRVAVIQGPPGTGKSFVGRELACMLLQQIDGPVLVLTYKNHALDEFLEGCIERVGLEAIARLGSRSKSLSLADRNVKALLRNRELTKRVVNPQTEDSVRDLRVQVQELVPQLTELVARRRSAAYITRDSALAAFLAQADEELLRQLWLDPKRGLDAKEIALLWELEGIVGMMGTAQIDATPGGEDESWVNSFREVCTYCVLTEQKHRHVEQAARVVLPWDASLLEIAPKMQSAITKLSHKMVYIFREWMPPPSGFEGIQRRIRAPVLPDAIAATGVDVSGHTQVEATDMIDAIDVTARRTMADDDHSKS